MNGVLVDSCVLLDLFTNDPNWADWSQSQLEERSRTNSLYINSIIYTELSMAFQRIEELEKALGMLDLRVLEMPREALFLAGKVFLKYRKNNGTKNSPLPDFFIGAHASVSNFILITRDIGKFTTYFPKIRLVHPAQ